MKRTPAAALALLLLAQGTAGLAQYRDERPVITPPPRPPARKTEDIAPLFMQAYRDAGRPRMALLWNREFGDRIQSAMSDRQVTRETGTAHDDVLEKTTQGPDGSARLKESSHGHDRSRTVTSSRGYEAAPARSSSLSERNRVMLQRVFVDEMRRGGVHFVDRALAVRLTAAAQHRAGGDPQLVETDALLAHSDLLVEVLMLEDKDAPGGYGFDVRAKDLRRGIEIASVYSRAMPPPPPAQPGRWTAGASDYVFTAASSPAATPSAAQVGAALARDVMFTLGSSFEASGRGAIPAGPQSGAGGRK